MNWKQLQNQQLAHAAHGLITDGLTYYCVSFFFLDRVSNQVYC